MGCTLDFTFSSDPSPTITLSTLVTDWLCWDLTDVSLGDEDEIVFCRYLCTSVLGEMWCNEDCSLVEILKLNFGHNMEAEVWSILWSWSRELVKKKFGERTLGPVVPLAMFCDYVTHWVVHQSAFIFCVLMSNFFVSNQFVNSTVDGQHIVIPF